MTPYLLARRGFDLGQILPTQARMDTNMQEDWHHGRPHLLAGLATPSIANHQDAITQSETLVKSILNGQEPCAIIDLAPYEHRLAPHFSSLGSTVNQGDDQEIEALMFDAVKDNTVIAEDLWMKVSWLSFYQQDASLRFRFSFGMDLVEDVAADLHRQALAAQLADVVFPESKIITHNHELKSALCDLLNCASIDYVERIVYFNAPNGGAYLHHDLERGHAGVAFAQLSGKTAWLALPKTSLVNEICNFVSLEIWPASVTEVMREELVALAAEPDKLAAELDSFANDALIHLINETKAFMQFLIQHGHAIILDAGDVLLLPQTNAEYCCWHSVFCLGDEIGQGLSFAIRRK